MGFGKAASAGSPVEIVTARHNDYTGMEKCSIQDQNHRFKFPAGRYIIPGVPATRFHVACLTRPDLHDRTHL
jgi:hypothetical protein